jgi:hypothetical protein
LPYLGCLSASFSDFPQLFAAYPFASLSSFGALSFASLCLTALLVHPFEGKQTSTEKVATEFS